MNAEIKSENYPFIQPWLFEYIKTLLKTKYNKELKGIVPFDENHNENNSPIYSYQSGKAFFGKLNSVSSLPPGLSTAIVLLNNVINTYTFPVLENNSNATDPSVVLGHSVNVLFANVSSSDTPWYFTGYILNY
jgi:hypothetical protein